MCMLYTYFSNGTGICRVQRGSYGAIHIIVLRCAFLGGQERNSNFALLDGMLGDFLDILPLYIVRNVFRTSI